MPKNRETFINEELVVFLEFVRTLLAGLLWEGQFERSSSGKWLGETTNLGMPGLCIVSKVHSCPCT